MLTNRERALIIFAYYNGVSNISIDNGMDEKICKRALEDCSTKLCTELGITNFPREEVTKFLSELENISLILCKEYIF